MKIISYIKLARINQWSKNSFVFAGYVFAGSFNDLNLFIKSIFASLIFCLASSSVYSFNDVVDKNKDKLHSLKKYRPIASGAIKVYEGVAFSVIMMLASISFSFIIDVKLLLIILMYFILSLAYTFSLKNKVITDVFCIALGFILRVLAGTYALNIPPSNWILLCTMMISLFLGFGKRYSEILNESYETREVLNLYEKKFLELFLSISCACTIMSYSLYTIDKTTSNIHSTNKLFLSIPLVTYAIFRYLYLILSMHKGGNPSNEIFADKQILTTVILYGILIIFVLR